VISQIDVASVKGYHLAGCTKETMGSGTVYIDYHGEAVRDPVWDLYQRCLDYFGAWPTLIEWENHVPPLERTLQEVEHAAMLLRPFADAMSMGGGQ